MKCLALFFLLLLCPALSRASTLCPWINATTAFAALDTLPEASGATATVTANSCTFTFRSPVTVRELRVMVDLSKDAAQSFVAKKTTCTTGQKPLRAIGNEAVACALPASSGTSGEQIISRVRDQLLTLTLTEKATDPANASRDLPSTAEMLAELVAGNLF
jgi:hypothetical protein